MHTLQLPFETKTEVIKGKKRWEKNIPTYIIKIFFFF